MGAATMTKANLVQQRLRAGAAGNGRRCKAKYVNVTGVHLLGRRNKTKPGITLAASRDV